MFEEVASAFVERRAFEAALVETESYRAANAALESQLGQAHEATLLAQADAETRALALDYYGTHEEDCAGWRDLRSPGTCSCGYDAARTAHPGQALADEVAAARAANAQGRRLADAVQAYFNTLGTNKIDRRPERYEIYGMAEALADYGIIEQQQAALLAAVAGADESLKAERGNNQ